MRAEAKNAEHLSELVRIIWPEHTLDELTGIIARYIASEDSAVFAEAANGEFVGVALCCLRHDCVEGCETSPVGYLEGVAVHEAFRFRGIAAKLVSECQAWAKEMGCKEFASDCELTNTASLRFHKSVGFQEMNRIICFKKTL